MVIVRCGLPIGESVVSRQPLLSRLLTNVLNKFEGSTIRAPEINRLGFVTIELEELRRRIEFNASLQQIQIGFLYVIDPKGNLSDAAMTQFDRRLCGVGSGVYKVQQFK